MSKASGFIALMKVIGEKIGKTVFDDVAKISDDVAKLAEKASSKELNIDVIRKVTKSVKKAKKYHDYIGKAIDDIAYKAYGVRAEQLKSVAGLGESAILQDAVAKARKFKVEINPEDYKDVNKLYGKLRDAGKKNIYNAKTNEWVSELMNYGGTDEMARIISSTTGTPAARIETMIKTGEIEKYLDGFDLNKVQALNKNVYATLAATRRVASDTMRKVNNFSNIQRFSGTLGDKISTLHDEFLKYDNKAGADACKMAHSFLNNAAAIETMTKAAKFNSGNLMEEMGIEKRKLMREYVSGMEVSRFSFANKLDDAGVPLKKIEGDWVLAEQLGLSVDDVSLFNRVKNIERVTLYGEVARAKSRHPKDFDDSVKAVASLYDNVQDDAIMFKENMSFGEIHDIGINYFPVKPSPEHMETIKQAKIAKYGVESLGGYSGEQRAFHKMSRNIEGSKASIDFDLRLDPKDEMSQYFDSVVNENTYKSGKQFIDHIGKSATIFDALNHSKDFVERSGKQNYADAYGGMLNNIMTTWSDMFAPQKQPTHWLTKGLANITDANTAIALGQSVTSLLGLPLGDFGGFVEGQRMPLFNFLQVLPTTAMFKGIMPTLGAIKDSPSFVKAFLASKGDSSVFKKICSKSNIELSIKSMTEGIQEPILKKAFADYWKYEAPDVTMQSLYTMNGRMQSVFSALTTIFKMSDISARGVGLTAAVKYGERQYSRHADSIAKGSAKAIDGIVKDLHMYEFNSLEREYIMEAVKNKPEFLSRFARMSVRSELFNYSRYFRPGMITKYKKHWASARAMRFMTWNMYYTNLLRGVKRSYDAGDKAPVVNAAKLASAWFGMLALSKLTDDETVDSFASYGIGRTPVIAPLVGMVNLGYRDVSGILAPSISTAAVLFLMVGDKIFDMIGNSKKDSIDYVYENVYNNFKRQPALRVPMVKELFEYTEELIQGD